jgi:pimeloyl-ACP methyl ester carboxylesterase
MKFSRCRRYLGVLAAVAVVAITAGVAVPAIANAQPRGNITSSSTSSSTGRNSSGPLPTIVLVHGAWADASSWDNVIPILEKEGYPVVAPPNQLRGLKSDAAFIASYLKSISGPIILVGHSYGGAVITNAALGNTNVKALVYVDGFEPAAGTTVEKLTFAKPGSCLAGGGTPKNVFNLVQEPTQPTGDYDLYLKVAPGTDYTGFDACFANDVTPQEAALLAAGQRPLALGALTTKSGTPAWATIPSWAVIGTQDRVIPPSELTFMATRAHSHITYVKAGHLSMISQPTAVARVITEAAQTEG